MAKNKRRPAERGMLPIWFSGSMITIMLLMVILLIGVILVRGLRFFWVNDVAQITYVDPDLTTENMGVATGRYGVVTGAVLQVLGEHTKTLKRERRNDEQKVVGTYKETRYKKGNRKLNAGTDFQWVKDGAITEVTYPEDVVVIERLENGNFYGFYAGEDMAELQTLRDQIAEENEPIKALREQSKKTSHRLYKLRETERLKLVYKRGKRMNAGKSTEDFDAKLAELDSRIATLITASDKYTAELTTAEKKLHSTYASFKDINGKTAEIAVADIVRVYQPNKMGIGAKTKLYFAKVWEIISTEPREANSEGGLFPAIYGTILLVFIMSIFVMPFGVIAAIYLREYAKEGPVVQAVRIAVNNLAGVPSIVYGMFGLGFFVYFVGGGIDKVFYPWKEQSTFGSTGILWASLTLAILTVPVVIVATEEALAAISRGIREGSYALGATKFQTVWKVLVPMASPGILTGFILAIARAAGEVAPLMLTGVIKHTKSQPFLGSHAPHIDQNFMHLGFHIYDVGFQSPNVEATMPMVYVTTLLLLTIVVAMNIVAIVVRNRMRRRFTPGAF